MYPVSDLYGLHPGSDIYVVGTGTSMRVFPRAFFDDKITIGLNLAWRLLPVRYGLTIHPDLNIPEFIGESYAGPPITWITKREKLQGLARHPHFPKALETFYYFTSSGKRNTQPPNQPRDDGRIPEWVAKPSGTNLYQWSSISQTGVNLAVNMGARNVILVGCDNCALGANHHADAQHTRWKGVDPAERYSQYYEGLAEVRAAARGRGVNVVSLTPFLGLDRYHQDFDRLCEELLVPKYIESPDISPETPHWFRRVAARTKRLLFL